jgi:hypothetical protein
MQPHVKYLNTFTLLSHFVLHHTLTHIQKLPTKSLCFNHLAHAIPVKISSKADPLFTMQSQKKRKQQTGVEKVQKLAGK